MRAKFLTTTNVTYWGTVLGSNEGIYVLLFADYYLSTKPLQFRSSARNKDVWGFVMSYMDGVLKKRKKIEIDFR